MLQDKNYNVSVLLAVWGEKFIEDFLQLSLPSLLASGNIPALASTYPTRFIILTRKQDILVFEKNPAYQLLKTICVVDFISIEDLIGFGNYAVTLTLAYDRAIRQAGVDMLNTYFVFLTSDYIMANGSMQGLIRHMKRGYSGICAGNFQVTQEGLAPYLQSQINPETQVLEVNPRELLKQSFQHLHPIVASSFYDQPTSHNYRANRFFFNVDSEVMVGRFYLLHMLCIKPETTDYKVGSHCDYSFVTEMCPSGNITVITDSDDYLVVEIQSKNQQLDSISFGQYNTANLVTALSEWTTTHHRENAEHSIYFHTRDIAEDDKVVAEQHLGKFINKLSKGLQKHKPQPYYNHPYWIGALSALNKQRELLEKSKDYDFLDLTVLTTSFFKKMYYQLYGLPPQVFRWHHRSREYRLTRNMIEACIAPVASEKIAVFYSTYQFGFMKYCSWLKNKLQVADQYYLKNLLTSPAKINELNAKKFELCILMMTMADLGQLNHFLSVLQEMLDKNGKVVVLIPNDGAGHSKFSVDFKREFAHKLNSNLNTHHRVVSVNAIHNNLSMLGGKLIDSLTQYFAHSQKMRFISYFLFGLPGGFIALIRSLLPTFSSGNSGYCTSIFMTLELGKQPEIRHGK